MELNDIEKEYLKLVDNGATSSWADIANNLESNKTAEQLKSEYKLIANYIAHRLGLKTLEELEELRERENVRKWLKIRASQLTSERREGFGGFEEFYKWYISKGGKCYYCGITQDELNQLFDTGKVKSKKPAFSAKLQIEKKNPNGEYNAHNCELVCCLCNNAKSDMISEEDYQKFLAKGMGDFLRSKL